MSVDPKAPTNPIDLNNIQGDILGGLTKKTETFLLFEIRAAIRFRDDLVDLAPLIKTTAQVLADREKIKEHKKAHPDGPPLPVVGVNIALSATGLAKVGITAQDINALGDNSFKKGQRKDAESLHDKGTGTGANFEPDWGTAFKGPIDGVIIVAGDSRATVNKKLDAIRKLFGILVGGVARAGPPSIVELEAVVGDARPGAMSAREHFGFLDGISNPTIVGFNANPAPGPASIAPGNILMMRKGDRRGDSRPEWCRNGSFLVFRKLKQLVPEFNKFIDDHPVVAPGLTKKEGSDLRAARMVGRWKSGAPIELSPLKDDPELGKDSQRRNNFRFAGQIGDQTRCPFASHIRKTYPRDDLEAHGFPIDDRRIMRRGIQFGPEVTAEEKASKTTQHGRGLLFACYQSSIDDGFHFMQTAWANEPAFPFTQTTKATPGIDAIIGQAPNGAVRVMSGTNPNKVGEEIKLPTEFVIPRGGEYFFSPSIETLKTVFAKKSA